MNKFRRITGILCGMIALCSSPVAQAQFFETPPPEIVSAWKFNQEDLVLVFRYDGSFYLVDATAEHPGMECGTFEWDKETGAFSVNVLVDTNGEAGLSHPGAATTVSISGNTLSYTVPGEGTFPFTRVVNTASAIVGSWAIAGEKFSVTFLADGSYYLSEETNDVPFGFTGMENGTYTWNSSSKAFTATAAIDTNGDVGVNGITLGDGVTVNITGNSLVFFDGVESTTLFRITTNPTPIRLPDFGAVRIADYVQTSTSTPTLLALDPGNENYPYTAEAFVDPAVGATSPTIKIGNGTAIPLEPEDPGSFEIEQGFATLADLNAFLPASSVVQFKDSADTANMTAGASLTFPSIPKIKVRDGASWSNGIYRFGDDEVLEWTLPTGFVASQYLTVVNVFDPVTDNDVVRAELHGDVNFLDLGGKLLPGKNYEVELEFYRIDGSTTAGTGVFSGKQGYLLSSSITTLRIRSLADTSQAPLIAEQPVSQSGTPGAPLVLNVGINEDAFPNATFKWFKDGQAIPGQTGNSIYIPSFILGEHSGIYKVIVTNGKGTAESNVAVIGNNDSTVEYVILEKSVFHAQTGANTVILDPTPVSPTNGGPFGFAANVQGQNMESLAAPTIAPPAGTPNNPPDDPFYSTLFLDNEESAWRYGPNANDWGDLSQAAIDSRFPNGTYVFLVNGTSVPLTLSGNSYPNTPQLTLTGGSWINGKYAIDAANPVTVTTNTFTAYGSNVDGLVELYAGDMEVISFHDSAPTANFASLNIPANTLPTNEITEVEALFGAIVDKETALPGSFSAALYSRTVSAEIHVLPKVISQSNSQVVPPNTSLDLQVSAIGSPKNFGGSLGYQWKKNGAILPGKTSPTLTIVANSAEIAGSYTCVVSNAVGTATTQLIILQYADAYHAYVTGFSLNSATTGLPENDFDNDGIANILEFVLGGNPIAPDANLLKNATTTPAASGRNLVFSYDRKTVANGISQVIETSTTLSGTWTPAVHGVDGVVITTATLDSNTQRVTATIPGTQSKLFVRLRATR